MRNLSEEVKAKNPSIWGIIWSPSEQFERIKERPKIWGALVLVTIMCMVGMWLSSLGVDMETGLEGFGEDEIAAISAFGTITLIIMGALMPVIGALISTVIYIIIAKIARSEVSFKQLFSMNTYLMIISALSLIVNGIGIVALGGNAETVYTSLGSIISVQGAMAGLLNNIELFTIWGLILSVIGLQKVAGFSKVLAWTVQIVLFVISILFAMASAALSGMFGV